MHNSSLSPHIKHTISINHPVLYSSATDTAGKLAAPNNYGKCFIILILYQEYNNYYYSIWNYMVYPEYKNNESARGFALYPHRFHDSLIGTCIIYASECKVWFEIMHQL